VYRSVIDVCLFVCLCVCLSVWCSVLEDEKVGLQRDLGDVESSLREVESARLESQHDGQELRRDLKSVETERNLLTANVNDLHITLTQADDKLEQLRKENFALKQKVIQ